MAPTGRVPKPVHRSRSDDMAHRAATEPRSVSALHHVAERAAQLVDADHSR